MEAAGSSQPEGAPAREAVRPRRRGWLASLTGRNTPISRLSPGKRVYAVGDIHGRLDLYEALLAKIAVDNERRGWAATELILLGDVIDRGPDSARLVEQLMAGGPAFARLIVLRGNHEQAMVDSLGGDLGELESWLDYGGLQTLASWGVPDRTLHGDDLLELLAAARALVPQPVLDWMAALPLYQHIGDYYFVHAGVKPGVALADQVEDDQLWIRHEFLDSTVDHGAVIVHGHTIHPAVQKLGNRIGIDTGAYKTGRLTALGLEDDKRWLLST